MSSKFSCALGDRFEKRKMVTLLVIFVAGVLGPVNGHRTPSPLWSNNIADHCQFPLPSTKNFVQMSSMSLTDCYDLCKDIENCRLFNWNQEKEGTCLMSEDNLLEIDGAYVKSRDSKCGLMNRFEDVNEKFLGGKRASTLFSTCCVFCPALGVCST